MNHNKRNFWLMFLDAIFFINAMTFISVNAVIPNFLNSLGASTFQISLASALVSIGAFVLQPIFAQMAMGLPVKTIFFSKLLTAQRLIFLAYVVSIPFLIKYSTNLSIILFLIFWGIFNMFVGCYSPFYMGVFSKVIPGNLRGRLQGFSGAVGNIIALGSAFLVGVLLKDVAFPYNYTWIFLIGTLILLIDAGDFALIREQPEVVQRKPISYLQYIKEIPDAFKGHKGYTVAVIGNCFVVSANVALAFYSVLAIKSYGAGPEQAAIITGIGIMVNIIGSVVLGIVADRIGHKYILAGASFFSILAAVVALSFHSMFAVYAGFALSSICAGGYNISSGINIINNCPQDKVPLYASINMMVTLAVSSLVTLLSGTLIDRFSFVPLFIITGLSAVAGFVVFLVSHRRLQDINHIT